MTDRIATGQDVLDALDRAGLRDPGSVMAYEGGTDLDKPGLGRRRRTRLDLQAASGARCVLFLKRYGRAPSWAERVRNWWRHGASLSAAEVEARNIEAASRAGVPTMTVAGFASGPWGSYLITTAVPGEALERQPTGFWQRLVEEERAGRDFVAALAGLVRRLHGAGYVHRDLYASHVFVDDRGGRGDLYLIDLARMFRPRWRRFRWRVKDLAELHYSLPGEWKARWWGEFLRLYLGGGDSLGLARWDRAVQRKSARIARRAAKRPAK